ncbi:MAG: hypothetical protein OXC46_06450 [Thaumarchaeota archaeon]|nr:hypothetical protein [Nitrososphaerota archaeon]
MVLTVVVSTLILFSVVSVAKCGIEDCLPDVMNCNIDGAFIITWEANTINRTITIPSINDTTEYGVMWDDGNADIHS